MKIFPNASKYLGFDDRIMVILGIPVVSLIIPPLFFGQYYGHGWLEMCQNWLSGLIFSSILWFGNRAILLAYRRKFMSREKERSRVIFTVIGVTAFTASVNIIAYLIMPESERLEMQGKGFSAGLFITLFIIAIYEAMWASARYRESKLETEQLRRENLQSQLSTLRSQISPHFLFNSLNTLASLIPEDPDAAVTFVQNLSRVYRCILEIRDRELITVEEELNCIENYISLLHTRFGQNLQVELKIQNEFKECFIVPLALQILIENAIKHNIVSSKRPLKVEIFVNGDGKLVVRNNLQRKDQEMESTGTGLQNITNRYRAVGQEPLTIIESDTQFTVVLPLLNIESYEVRDH